MREDKKAMTDEEAEDPPGLPGGVDRKEEEEEFSSSSDV